MHIEKTKNTLKQIRMIRDTKLQCQGKQNNYNWGELHLLVKITLGT